MAQEPNNLYPLEAKIKYHTDWTKNHYVVRLNEFSSDPAKEGDVIFIGDSITEGGKAWSSKFNRNDIKNRGISGDLSVTSEHFALHVQAVVGEGAVSMYSHLVRSEADGRVTVLQRDFAKLFRSSLQIDASTEAE